MTWYAVGSPVISILGSHTIGSLLPEETQASVNKAADVNYKNPVPNFFNGNGMRRLGIVAQV